METIYPFPRPDPAGQSKERLQELHWASRRILELFYPVEMLREPRDRFCGGRTATPAILAIFTLFRGSGDNFKMLGGPEK